MFWLQLRISCILFRFSSNLHNAYSIVIDVKPPKPLLHANFGGYFLFQDDGLCAASFHFPFDSCNATGCHAIALGCSVASRRFLWAAPRGVRQAHPHHLPRYRRLPCVLRAHPPVPRRQRQDGAHDHVPRVPARRARPLYRARRRHYFSVSGNPDVQARRGGCFSEFLQAYGRTKFGEFSSCILPSLLLRLLEKYIKHSSFDERDLSFFKWCGISPRELSLLVITG